MATVTVLSRTGMEAETPRSSVVVISIHDPGDPLHLDDWDNVFRFAFDDISEREEALSTFDGKKNRKLVAFTEAMAKEIMQILGEFPTHDFIVHCNAGVSRSVAVGRFIAEETGRKLILRGNCWSDENANGLVLRLLHRQVWFAGENK